MIELNVANIQFKSDKLIEILQKRIVKNDGFVTIDWQSEIHRFLCEGVMTDMTSIMWGDYGIENFDECMAMNSFGAFEIIMKSLEFCCSQRNTMKSFLSKEIALLITEIA